jgi:hypothetical protein
MTAVVPPTSSTPLELPPAVVPAPAATSPAGAITTAILNGIPSGWGTSEAKIIVSVLTFLGALVAVFDILMASGAFPGIPGGYVAGVDGAYAAVAAYVSANYAQARSTVKAAALAAGGTSGSPASTP